MINAVGMAFEMNVISTTTYDSIIAEAQHYLRFLKDFGCDRISCTRETMEIIASWQVPQDVGMKAVLPAQPDSLASIHDALSRCRRCRLAEERKAAVSGSGSETAKLMLIGGFPEVADEETGVPYSGEAGKLLTRIIEAIKFKRESTYICHAVKCRPTEGKLPDRFVAKACRTFLDREIEAIQPALICVFGELAAQSLLRTDTPIVRMRGRLQNYNGIPVMPTHEPEYLIANPEAKRGVWEDMKQVIKLCEELNIY